MLAAFLLGFQFVDDVAHGLPLALPKPWIGNQISFALAV
jgi:hypothetical protein